MTGSYREITVHANGDGMRLDRWLAARFTDYSRSAFTRAIRQGLVRDRTGRVLDGAHRVREGDVLHLFVPGLAPSSGPPPFPDILFETSTVVVLNKPAGLLAHPSGNNFAYAVISLAKQRFVGERVDLVHRLDRDTSGALILTRNLRANQFLKEAVADGRVVKEYEAIVKGVVPWDERRLNGPIGAANGPIRVQMAVRDDGLPARTDVTVLERGPCHTRVRCRLYTGRTHQIRVHLAHEGFPLLGDRLYGVPADVFLHAQDHGADTTVLEAAGAPRHALHARRLVLPLEDGSTAEVVAPLPPDMVRWWRDPQVLPFDNAGATGQPAEPPH